MGRCSLDESAGGALLLHHTQPRTLGLAQKAPGTTSHSLEARETLFPSLAFSPTNCMTLGKQHDFSEPCSSHV